MLTNALGIALREGALGRATHYGIRKNSYQEGASNGVLADHELSLFPGERPGAVFRECPQSITAHGV